MIGLDTLYGSDISDDELETEKIVEKTKVLSTSQVMTLQQKTKKLTASQLKRMKAGFEESAVTLERDRHHSSESFSSDAKRMKREGFKAGGDRQYRDELKSKKVLSSFLEEEGDRHHSSSLPSSSLQALETETMRKEESKAIIDHHHHAIDRSSSLQKIKQPTLKIERLKMRGGEENYYTGSLYKNKLHVFTTSETERLKKEESLEHNRSKQLDTKKEKRDVTEYHHYSTDAQKGKQSSDSETTRKDFFGPKLESSHAEWSPMGADKKYHKSLKKAESLGDGHSKKKDRKRSKSPLSHRHLKKKKHHSRHRESEDDYSSDDGKKRSHSKSRSSSSSNRH